MKYIKPLIILAAVSTSVVAAGDEQLKKEILQLQQQTRALQAKLEKMEKKLGGQKTPSNTPKESPVQSEAHLANGFHTSPLVVNTPDAHPESAGFYPTALVADRHVLTYIAGTPVVTSPYLGDRPAFDGSDYIVNISSINRDIRLMQQRRKLYRAYQDMGYPIPNRPIVALSGKSEPVANWHRSFAGTMVGDLSLGASELDVAAALNEYVEAFIGIAYDDGPLPNNGQRLANSSFDLNLGFVNIGNLDRSPFYFTAGQLYAPYGRYSSAMVSSPLTMSVARTKTRPFILGYKSQGDSGPYAAVYGFASDTTLQSAATGGFNLGWIINHGVFRGDIGGGVIQSINDSQGMQNTGSTPLTTFGGFASPFNGSEAVKKIPGADLHANINFDRYNFTAEWVGVTEPFRQQDLSFNGRGAKPQAAQFEGGVTFKAFHKPASFALGYQWSKNTLALNLPKERLSGVFNISIWKDTVESLEYRHDTDFSATTFANGAAAAGFVNANTWGTGRSADSVIAQLGVYF